MADDLKELTKVVRDIATFIPTKDETTGGVVGGGGADGAVVARKISKALAQVLGRPIGRDPRSFMAALTAAFPEGKDGQIVSEPVRAVVSLEVDSGQLAASQAALFHEVQVIVTDALQVLDGLYSISPVADPQKVAALTEIVRSEFSSIIQEASRVDRPRKSRIDEIFVQLGTPDARGALPVNSHLFLLRQELGLDSLGDMLNNTGIVTTEEAQLMANMALLVQYAGALNTSFNNFIASGAGLDPRNGSFSGRLAFVSMLFSVVAAAVSQLEADMDAVEFSEAERRTAFIKDPTTGGQFLISIDGILSWVRTFVEEGQDLIAKSGRFGLDRVLGIVNGRLEPLVSELLRISQGTSRLNPKSPHPGLTHSRVQNALEQLDDQLKQFNPSLPPSANFTFSPANPGLNQNITFDATGSSGGGGNIISYKWDFGDGTASQTVTGTTITHQYTSSGLYTVTLTITTDNNMTDNMKQTVKIPPLADFSFPIKIVVNQTVNFDATASAAGPGGKIISYEWDFGDGNLFKTGTGKTRNRYTSTGLYNVTLTVTDSNGLTNSTNKTVAILPSVKFTVQPANPGLNQNVNFDATASSAGAGNIILYEWDFGDGNSLQTDTEKTTYQYTTTGSYNVTLTVTDSNGLTNSTTVKNAVKVS